MKLRKLFTGLAALALLAGLSLAQPPAKAKHQSFTGEVSDTMCGAKHMMADAAECTRACVSKGSNYALVAGDKVYTLKGHEADLEKLAGKKATVTGTADGDTIEVASVKGS